MTAAAAPARLQAALTAAFSIPGADLCRLAAAVTPHAADDPDTPALCAVQWEIRDGALWLAATDTHTIGAARWPLPGGPVADAGPVLLPVSETVLLTGAVGAGPAVLTIDPAAAAVTAVWNGGTYQARGLLPVPWEIPGWRSVLTGLLDGTPATAPVRLMFDPAHLTRFTVPSAGAQADPDRRFPLLRFQLRRHLATRRLTYLVTCYDWFIGAISPLIAGPGGGECGDTIISRWATCLHATAAGGLRR